MAHTTVSRFVDHIPYYRQEQINARSGIHTPRSTLASWSGQAGAAEFCLGRGAKYPLEFLKGLFGTLICDGYRAYDKVMEEDGRIGAGCFAHARRKFDELVKDNLSPVGTQAIQRIAALYKIERQIHGFSAEDWLVASGLDPVIQYRRYV